MCNVCKAPFNETPQDNFQPQSNSTLRRQNLTYKDSIVTDKDFDHYQKGSLRQQNTIEDVIEYTPQEHYQQQSQFQNDEGEILNENYSLQSYEAAERGGQCRYCGNPICIPPHLLSKVQEGKEIEDDYVTLYHLFNECPTVQRIISLQFDEDRKEYELLINSLHKYLQTCGTSQIALQEKQRELQIVALETKYQKLRQRKLGKMALFILILSLAFSFLMDYPNFFKREEPKRREFDQQLLVEELNERIKSLGSIDENLSLTGTFEKLHQMYSTIGISKAGEINYHNKDKYLLISQLRNLADKDLQTLITTLELWESKQSNKFHTDVYKNIENLKVLQRKTMKYLDLLSQ